MGTNLLSLPDDLLLGRRTFGFFDDFLNYTTTDLWTTATTVDGTAAVDTTAGASRGGVLKMTTAATSAAGNEAIVVATTTQLFKFTDGKPLVCEARIKYAEAATDDANVFFGFADAIAVGTTQDDGAGPPADYEGACFFKVDGGANWNVEVSDGTTQITSELTAVNSLDGLAKACSDTSSFQVFQIKVQPTSSTRMDVPFFIDGPLVKMIDSTYAAPTDMDTGIVVKDGSATNEEILYVDYISAYQLR